MCGFARGSAPLLLWDHSRVSEVGVRRSEVRGGSLGARSEAVACTLAAAGACALLAAGAVAGALALLIAVAVVQGLLVLTWALSCGPPRESDPLRSDGELAGYGSAEPPDIGLSSSDQGGPEVDRFALDRFELESVDPGRAVPGRIGTVLIGGAAAAGADIAASVRPHDALAPMLVVLGLAIPAMFAHQLTRGVVRTRVVESLSGIAVIVGAVVALTALLQLRHEFDGARLAVAAVVVAGAAIVLAGLVDLAWSRPRFDPTVARGLTGVVVGIIAATVVGVLVLRPLTQYGNPVAVLLCAIIAAVAALLSVSASMIAAGIGTTGALAQPQNADGSGLRPLAVAILPVCLVAPVAYLLLLVR